MATLKESPYTTLQPKRESRIPNPESRFPNPESRYCGGALRRPQSDIAFP
jgi:hypothetical protein